MPIEICTQIFVVALFLSDVGWRMGKQTWLDPNNGLGHRNNKEHTSYMCNDVNGSQKHYTHEGIQDQTFMSCIIPLLWHSRQSKL